MHIPTNRSVAYGYHIPDDYPLYAPSYSYIAVRPLGPAGRMRRAYSGAETAILRAGWLAGRHVLAAWRTDGDNRWQSGIRLQLAIMLMQQRLGPARILLAQAFHFLRHRN